VSEHQETLAALAASAYGLYSACCIGNPPPFVARLREALRNPRPGDLVLEITSFRRADDLSSHVGELVRIAEEPCMPPGEWDEAVEGRPVPMERVQYVRTLDGSREVRWVNAEFIRVFRDWREFSDTSL
jgi:hypothetical protein